VTGKPASGNNPATTAQRELEAALSAFNHAALADKDSVDRAIDRIRQAEVHLAAAWRTVRAVRNKAAS